MKTAHVAVYDSLADWEIGHLLVELRTGRFTGTPFDVVTVAETTDPITTMGGIRMLPDRMLADLDPADSALLVLPGADLWDAGRRRTVRRGRGALPGGRRPGRGDLRRDGGPGARRPARHARAHERRARVPGRHGLRRRRALRRRPRGRRRRPDHGRPGVARAVRARDAGARWAWPPTSGWKPTRRSSTAPTPSAYPAHAAACSGMRPPAARTVAARTADHRGGRRLHRAGPGDLPAQRAAARGRPGAARPPAGSPPPGGRSSAG